MSEEKSGSGVWRVSREAAVNWFNHNAPSQAAALSFYTVLSLAPLLLVVVSVAGIVFAEEAVRAQIVYEFDRLTGPQGGAIARSVLESMARPDLGTAAGIIGVATLLVGATAVFVQFQDSLNAVWEVAPAPGSVLKNLLVKRLLSFAIALGIGFLLLVSLAMSAAITAFSDYLERRWAVSFGVMEASNFILSFALISVLFALSYRILPDAEIRFREVWVGAVATSLLFTLGKSLIGMYLGSAGVGSAYGAAGSLMVLLVWVYYCSLVILFGAEFTRAYSRRYRRAVPPSPGARRAPAAATPGTALAPRLS